MMFKSFCGVLEIFPFSQMKKIEKKTLIFITAIHDKFTRAKHSDSMSASPKNIYKYAIHVNICPSELKETERDRSIKSIIHHQVLEAISTFPLKVVCIVTSYTFEDVCKRMVRALAGEDDWLCLTARRFLVSQYKQGVIRVGVGVNPRDLTLNPHGTWCLSVVYIDPIGRRMIHLWRCEGWTSTKQYTGYVTANNEYPKPLAEFWRDREEWEDRHLKWYGIVPPELGKIPEPELYDDMFSAFGYNCDKHKEQFDKRMVLYEKNKDERARVEEKLMKTPINDRFHCHTVPSKQEQIPLAENRELYKTTLFNALRYASSSAWGLMTNNEFLTLGIVRYTETKLSSTKEGSLLVVFVDNNGRRVIQQFHNSNGGYKENMYKPKGDPERVELYWRKVDVNTYKDQRWFGLTV
jgi:hypothetical protein